MQSAYECIICILLLTISTSSVASTAVACLKKPGEPLKHESVIASAHGNHMAGHHDSGSPDNNLLHGNCSCCDDCTSICPSVTANPVAYTSTVFNPDLWGNEQTGVLTDLIHESPVPHPLFRPPIQYC